MFGSAIQKRVGPRVFDKRRGVDEIFAFIRSRFFSPFFSIGEEDTTTTKTTLSGQTEQNN